jgi:hypothetical protein
MPKATDIAVTYFRKRTYFRICLIVLILSFWGYIEISDLFPLPEHDLNYHATAEIQARYQGGPIRFAVLGDCKNSPAFDDVLNALNRDTTLMFAVINGDLVLYPTNETFRAFLEQRRSLRIPSVTVPGNHDIAIENRHLYYTVFGRFYYSFSLGDSTFIMLDDSNETELGDEQMGWLEKQLQNAQTSRYRFVFLHVPLWDPRDVSATQIRFAHSLKNSDQARRLQDLFMRYRVTTVFASHIHAFYDISSPGPRTIITGGAGAELVGHDPEHTFFHYARVQATPQGVSIEPVRVDLEIPFTGFKKYWAEAKLYAVTFGKIYMLNIVLGLLIVVLTADAVMDLWGRKKKRQGLRDEEDRETEKRSENQE